MTELTPVHIGLMGHIDHGKTELARALSEKVSTAGLDKHPQARMRGITIDLGFTMFTLGDYLVTLVDAPGHADLIRSVVASATIIDAAILVVAADEGPKVQTGEHILVLQSMGISDVVVAITKTDLVDEHQADLVEKRVRQIMRDTEFSNVELVRVSAKKGVGIKALKEKLLRIITPQDRDISGPLLVPIDHAFPVKGHGTVITGTILRGRIAVDDTVNLAPQNLSARVRSIQIFGKSVESAKAGDRIGVNLPEIDHHLVKRGSYICKDSCPERSRIVRVALTLNPIYQGIVRKKMLISATIGMPSVTAEIVPFREDNGRQIVIDEVSNERFKAILFLKKPIPIEPKMNALLLRTDLPPTSMRIMASGQVESVVHSAQLYVQREHIGKIFRIRESDVLIEGLAHSKDRAMQLCGMSVHTHSGAVGELIRPFGTRGVISARFDREVSINDDVVLVLLRKEEFRFGR